MEPKSRRSKSCPQQVEDNDMYDILDNAHHQRRVLLVGTGTHRRSIVGKPYRDKAPPTRASACHPVLPSATGVVHAHRACHSPCLANLLPRDCLPLHCRRLPHLPLPLVLRKQKLKGRLETSWSTGETATTLWQISSQGVSLFRAQSRPVSHGTSNSLE